jgi:hypothetical protein
MRRNRAQTEIFSLLSEQTLTHQKQEHERIEFGVFTNIT